ncbi:S8 family serine peptidase [Streptomyces sp. GbtcB7]|uniref:S8 family serine peptidase n=1 Tax=Streptomyces sp. GbtcB7 TaxID=2824752 RepID=UPI001C30E1C2|nr:S8 family serine peptidase [Streptomyces sp. GbtcB7]
MAAALFLCASVFTAPEAAALDSGDDPADITAAVERTLDDKGAADVWLVFDDKADLSKAAAVGDWNKRGQAVVDALKATAKSSQAEARAGLEAAGADFTSYWISNQIHVPGADEDLVTKLAALPNVQEITGPQDLSLEEPKQTDAVPEVNSVEWGLAAINADDVWREYADTGEGITVASIDSGVQYDHPALTRQYRGRQADGTYNHNYNWYDPAHVCGNPSTAPCDNAGHGTHTVGTMVGDDGAGNQIGVAPGAKWIAAKGCESANCSEESLLTSGQWMLAPTDLGGADPRPDLRPNIINNSWGEPNGGVENPWYDDVVAAWTASGIFGTFSNGNDGRKGCDTAGSPADGKNAYGVGAFTSSGSIADFSSRGPGADGEFKPNISAPGAGVRSSLPGGTYGAADGTSMAAPHVSGAVALLWSASPGLIGHIKETTELLDGTAHDVDDTTCGGSAADNNVWGEGKLDVLAAVQAAPGAEAGVLTGTVTDATTGKPVAGARITLTGTSSRTITTEADGTYRLTVVPGDYTAVVSVYGYDSSSVEVTAADDATVTTDFPLTPKPAWKVTGTVRTAAGDALEGATLSVPGTPLQPVHTDESGRYTLPSVAAGTYTLSVASPLGCVADAESPLTVDGEETADVTLDPKTDSFGYTCATEKSAYVEGDTPFALSGDEAGADLPLPFDFPLYTGVYRGAFLSTDGYLSFTSKVVNPFNNRIPDGKTPNAVIYPFWDDLRIDPAFSKVYTKTLGEAPNRRFVIEQRDVTMFGASAVRIDFEVVLHETTGEIVFAYRNLNPDEPRETGLSATVGIEDGTGGEGLQYAYEGSTALSDATAIRITPNHSGFVGGVVKDANDGGPVARATVTVSAGGRRLDTTTTDDEGRYAFRLKSGSGYDLAVDAQGYGTQLATAAVSDNKWTITGFSLPAGALKVTLKGDLDPWVVAKGATAKVPVTISNTGGKALNFDTAEIGGKLRTGSLRDPGEVISKIATPDLQKPMGVTVGGTGNIWVADTTTRRYVEYDRETHAPTGRKVLSWYTDGDFGITYDTKRDLVCQPTRNSTASVINCVDPDTEKITQTIDVSGVGGGYMPGVAYRADDDTFYLGSSDTGKVYRVAGASHAAPGKVLSSCQWNRAINGVAYHAGTGNLYLTSLAGSNAIHEFDPVACKEVGTLPDPDPNPLSLSGIAVDPSGDLWVASHRARTAYRISTGRQSAVDVPWLSVTADDTTLEPGESTTVTVDTDTAQLESGTHKGYLEFFTDAARPAPTYVPIKLVVPKYVLTVDAGSDNDPKYTAGSHGWVGKSDTYRVGRNTDIKGTDEDAIYRTQREGMTGYRFDALPAGTYEVTLDFAELRKQARPGWRMFNVFANDTPVLASYDITKTAGKLTADRRTILVKVGEAGSIGIRFDKLRTYQLPVVNAVKVVQRPDLT